MIWLSILYLFISVYIHLYSIYLYPSFHSFIYWIIINTFLRTTSRCIESVFCLSVWLRGKICLYIQQFIYLSISSNKSIYLHVYQSSIYIFLKLCETPCNIIFFHVCYCMSSKSVSLLRANAPQSTCLSIGLAKEVR